MRDHPAIADIHALLKALTDQEVEFIVVGAAAGVIQGALSTTADLDVVHRRTPENVERLYELLRRLDAKMRFDLAGRELRPTQEMLLGSGHVNLSTTLGPLDPLCELSPGEAYETLLPETEVVRDSELEVRVLTLEALIRLKSASGRAKDKLALPLLIATLEEREKRR